MQDVDSRPTEYQQEANPKMRKSESALHIEPYTPLRIRIESTDSDVLDIVPKTAQPQLKHTSEDTSVSGPQTINDKESSEQSLNEKLMEQQPLGEVILSSPSKKRARLSDYARNTIL